MLPLKIFYSALRCIYYLLESCMLLILISNMCVFQVKHTYVCCKYSFEIIQIYSYQCFEIKFYYTIKWIITLGNNVSAAELKLFAYY